MLNLQRPVALYVIDSEFPLILSLETATRTGSVALTRGPQLLAMRAGEAQVSHSTKLLQRVEEVLEEAGANLADVELFAAACGPGSFTGLRIGLATVKSFAATLSRACVGVPTLAAVAHAAGSSKLTLAMIPAGRGEVFAQLFRVNEDGAVTPHNEASHQSPEKSLADAIKYNQLTLAGEGVQQHESLVKAMAERARVSLAYEKEALSENVEAVEKLWRIASPAATLATNIAVLAYMSYRRGETTGPEQLKAIYVRPSDAELNLKEQ
jgi:tRNA threonylcarbamoyladenosine biosynthesis protein TsaB